MKMPKNKKTNKFSDYSAMDITALALQVYRKQGFIRSGEGYTKVDGDKKTVIKDNKTVINELVENGSRADTFMEDAKSIVDKFNGKLMMKKFGGELKSFEKGLADALNAPELSNFHVSVLASLPHMHNIDRKRAEVEDRYEKLRASSKFFGDARKRYDIEVEVIDVKFIQSSSVYMITTVHNKEDVIKFWWRDQPDLSDILDGKIIKIRGTVNKHEISKYTRCKETMFNRVKVLDA